MKKIYIKMVKNIYGINNLEFFLEAFFKRIEFELSLYNTKSLIYNSTLNYTRSKPFSSHNGKGLKELFRIIIEGEFKIIKSRNRVTVTYKSNFTQHLFKSVIFGISGVLFSILMDYQLTLSSGTIVFLCICLPLIAVGYLITIIKMKYIFNKGLKEGQKAIKYKD